MNAPGGPRGLVVLAALTLATPSGASSAIPIPTTTTAPALSTTTVALPTTTLLATTTLVVPTTTLTVAASTTTTAALPTTTLTLPVTTTTVVLPTTTLTLLVTTTTAALPTTTLTLPVTTTTVVLPTTTLTLPVTTTVVLPTTTLTLPVTTTLTLPVTTTTTVRPTTTLTLPVTTTTVVLPTTTLTLPVTTTTVVLPTTTLTLPVTTTTVVLPTTTLTLPVTTTTVVLPTTTLTTLTLPVTTTTAVRPTTTLTSPVTTTTAVRPTTTLTLPVTTTTAVLPTTTRTLPTTTSPTSGTTSTSLAPTTGPLFELALTLRPARSPSSVSERMGAALAANDNDDTFLIGAPGDGSAAPDAGIVYVVSASSPTFGRLLRVLQKPGTPAAGDAFGAAVTAVGQNVLVGAPGDNTAAPGGGAAFVFGPTGSAPTTLLPPRPATDGGFGAAVADRGGDLLVGAPGTGTVHLFRGGTGEPLLTFESPAGAGRFGSTLAAVGANVLVGAPGRGNAPGRAFVFAGDTGSLLLEIPNPVATAGDQFGFAVAVAGNRLLIGAPGDHEDAGRVFLFDATGRLIRFFVKPTPRAGDRFGTSIAVTEAGLLVGAPSDADLAPAGGAAYLFDLDTGELHSVLRKAEPRPEDLFGTAVAGLGARVLVGAPGDDSGLVDGGAAYVFSGSTLEAVFRKRLSAAAFGASVAAAGGDVLVGAPHGAGGAGAVGRFDGTSGAAVATLESPAPGDSSFGFSVAALGNNVVVGAPFLAAAEGPDVGAVYRFQGTTLAGILANPRPVAGDQFGFSIAPTGADVLVGVPLAGAHDVGLAYVLDGVTGEPRVIFEKAIPVAGDFFGAAVAAQGDEVLVGAPLDSAAVPNAGAAYLFRRNKATLERTFQSPAPASGDLFGAAVALAGSRVVIGAPSAAGGATAAGAVHVFDRASGDLIVTIQNPTPDPGDQFGSAVAVAAGNVLVGAPGDDTAVLDTGAAYLFDGATGALLQTFLNPAQGAFDHFGFAVGGGPSGLLVGAPGPSRVYVFRPGAQASRAPRPETIVPAAGGPQCGNGIIEPGEECDDGNAVDTDDCRNDCTRAFCCTLDPLQQERCDDNDPCTDDSLDPTAGCIHVPNGRCCQSDADCGSGMCRVCDGCFLFPFACCAQGSTCQALAPECGGTTCLAAAFCRCEGGLACSGDTVPSRTKTLFTLACDQVRLGESVTPADPSSRREQLRLARRSAHAARRMARKAARATRKLMRRGTVSKGCGSNLLAKIKSVRKAIPLGRKLRQCVLAP